MEGKGLPATAPKECIRQISNLDDETARTIQNDDRVIAGFSYLLGMIDYGEYKVAVRSMDENLMQLAKYPALYGSLPKTETEVAVTQAFLDRKGISCEIGDTIRPALAGDERSYTVCGILPVTSSNYAIFVMPAFVKENAHKITNGHGALAMDTAVLFASEELFQELYPEIRNFDYSWSVVSAPAKAEYVESRLRELLSGYSDLGLDTIGAHIEYEKMQSSIIFGGMHALSWLIFLFGVVNLINTTLSNQVSRKRENSILRSVGLTGKQLCRMNIIEGMCYAFFAVLAVLAVGLPLSIAICAEISKKSFAGTVVPYQFPFLEMGLFLFVLFGMELVLSVWMACRQKKHSLIEQIRLNG